ncbi:MAG: helix-turn-helix transcriptional regulator [Lachnospiraceae bacterium]|nr:helix-turn-helix transcriptional regulator [Lachnospiraceae bacterium]
MKTQEAVVRRIKGLCKERNLNISQLAYCAGMPPSTLKNVMNGNSKNTGIVTIKIICDGLDVSLEEFFHSGLFSVLEQEID